MNADSPCPPWCTSKHLTEVDGDRVHSRWVGRDHRSVTLTQIGGRPPLVHLFGPDQNTDLGGLTPQDALGLAALVDDLGADHLAGLLREAARIAAEADAASTADATAAPRTTPQTTKTEAAA